MKRRALKRALFAYLALAGCGDPAAPPSAAVSALPAGTLARVDSELISRASVDGVAERQGLVPREALARLLSDALLAVEARRTLPSGVTPVIERAAGARALLEKLHEEARAAGPASDSELRSLLEERWPALDRPPAARTLHAVVLSSEPARDARARAVAEAVLSAVRGTATAADFEKQAKTVATDGFELRVEELPPITADGRAFERQESSYVVVPTTFDKDFAVAANALAAPGAISPVTKTAFGYHVIRLQEHIPGASLAPAELQNAVLAEVQTRRAARARKELLETLRGGSPVQIERSVDELTARARVAP